MALRYVTLRYVAVHSPGIFQHSNSGRVLGSIFGKLNHTMVSRDGLGREHDVAVLMPSHRGGVRERSQGEDSRGVHSRANPCYWPLVAHLMFLNFRRF